MFEYYFKAGVSQLRRLDPGAHFVVQLELCTFHCAMLTYVAQITCVMRTAVVR